MLVSEKKKRFQHNKDNKRHRWTFYSEKGDTTSRRHNICTHSRSKKIYETITTELKAGTDKKHNHNRGPKNSIDSSRQIIQTENR